MGMRTTLYGYIEEMDFWSGPVTKLVKKHNTSIINALPKGDEWPPLSKEMFAICNNFKNTPGPNFEYSGRIIHFGANLKSVEYEWDLWKTKFENLLTNLFFLEAVVHFKTEYSDIQTATWSVNLLKYSVRHDEARPDKVYKSDWNYESTYDQ